jgi:hypothetical protein
MSASNQHPFIPLHAETRAALDTKEAARHLRREAQTLRSWACKGTGPIKPIRIGGRLLWRTADIRRLLGVELEPKHPVRLEGIPEAKA